MWKRLAMCSIEPPRISEEEIYKESKIIKTEKFTSLENVPPGILKDVAGMITKPLTDNRHL